MAGSMACITFVETVQKLVLTLSYWLASDRNRIGDGFCVIESIEFKRRTMRTRMAWAF
jgi:hypothetical protein